MTDALFDINDDGEDRGYDATDRRESGRDDSRHGRGGTGPGQR